MEDDDAEDEANRNAHPGHDCEVPGYGGGTPPVSRAAPSASKSAPRAPTIKPTSPMRLAVPAAKAAISPITREGSTAADQPRGYRRDKLMPRCAGRSPLA